MKRALRWIGLVLLVVLLVGVGYGYSVYKSVSGFNKENKVSIFDAVQEAEPAQASPPPKWEGKERVNVLLLGGDSRGLKTKEIPRSDTLMIASIDPVTKKAALLSILRDTYVKIPDHGQDRINSALALGGPRLAMRTVSELLGIPIQYYVYTDFKGFIALVDALGGIDLEVEKDMKYTDSEDGPEYAINLKKGYQHLDGKTALQYVRFRYDATSDFTRTERQRKFLTAVADKMKTTSALIKLPRILQSMDPYIETNLLFTDMLKLGTLGYEAKTEGIAGIQLPPTELLEDKRIGGAEVIGVDPDKLKAYVRNMLGGMENADFLSPSPTVKGGTPVKRDAAVTSTPTRSPSPSATRTPTPSPTAKNVTSQSPEPDGSEKPDGKTASASPLASPTRTPLPSATVNSITP